MKTIKLTLLILGFISLSAIHAQEPETPSHERMYGEGELKEETTEKTYRIISNGRVIKNSVKISSSVVQSVQLDENDKDLVDQDRVYPEKKIIKTVQIDNDEDDDYDELITFSYTGESTADFILITNGDEIVVALDKGDNLSILENVSVSVQDWNTSKEAYVFTDDEGQSVEFYIEEYRKMDRSGN